MILIYHLKVKIILDYRQPMYDRSSNNSSIRQYSPMRCRYRSNDNSSQFDGKKSIPAETEMNFLDFFLHCILVSRKKI